MRFLNLVTLSVLLTLTGCSHFSSKEQLSGSGQASSWQAHKQQITPLDAWQINGKLGIRSEQESGSAILFWLQRQDYFDIRLSGPLGQGSTRLTGRQGAVSLEIANRGTFKATTAEALMQQQLGWSLPVENLLWWVRGLPAPRSKSQAQLNNDSVLTTLKQDQWLIEYLSYRNENGVQLPERIKLTGAGLNITLVIKQWQARQLGQ
ncbi:outer membrane lipoprotein LolB [Pseudomonas sp. C27(2019)]|uniref:lipoprotein insertase outer membrane protein LolB n=1 Tax=Pseudomonas sp. C27(2019) TaxID=2604941 RepID=UPI00124752BF|nr:lipoprotein insertase outer membrane protein LolB [Pseudomonas sp. C27(2019)]QEY58213.1 outer membrane lipoprotein LolB [Pseudomonas sp. C27(2019)]